MLWNAYQKICLIGSYIFSELNGLILAANPTKLPWYLLQHISHRKALYQSLLEDILQWVRICFAGWILLDGHGFSHGSALIPKSWYMETHSQYVTVASGPKLMVLSIWRQQIHYPLFNSLWPGDAIKCYWSWSSLAQVMAHQAII